MKDLIEALMYMVQKYCTCPKEIIEQGQKEGCFFKKDKVYTFGFEEHRKAIVLLKNKGYLDDNYVLNWDKLKEK